MSFLTDRFDALAGALDRRIDNELNAEFQPSPHSGYNDGVVVKTSDDETGSAKLAGTGGRIVPQISNSILFAGLAVVGVFAVWKVVK